jgi:hypothetical protein
MQGNYYYYPSQRLDKYLHRKYTSQVHSALYPTTKYNFKTFAKENYILLSVVIST